MSKIQPVPPAPGDRNDGAPALAAAEVTLGRFLATADVHKVFGEAVVHGDTTIIPAAEVAAAFGMGVGSGRGGDPSGDGGGGGGGGGGTTFARPVAVIVATPAGVRVEPVFDWSKLGLAAFTAAGFALAGLLGWIRPEKALRRLRPGRP
jgi:Sporulation protein YtfJ (Spore_YtfJ)